ARTYLAANPDGAHAEELRDWLLGFERHRENWVGALRVAEGDPDASDAELDVLRERAAEQALGVASAEKRSDLRARLLANVVRAVGFERARTGLAADVDERPGCEARYAYRGMRERYGMVRSREALIPVELVVQGSLTDLTLGAFPRLRPPKITPDAVLYRD